MHPYTKSRSPVLCSWITEAITAVYEELSKGTVGRIAIVLYHGVVGEVENGTSLSVVERHMLDVGSLPIISERGEMQEIERQERDPLSPDPIVSVDYWKSFETAPSVLPRLDKTEPLDEDTRPDLGEQLRAVFLRLEQRCAELTELSEPRSFMICMELKDDAKDSPWQDPVASVHSLHIVYAFCLCVMMVQSCPLSAPCSSTNIPPGPSTRRIQLPKAPFLGSTHAGL
jgi:mitotic spindle assembly checkpoint protein MAD2B